MRVLVTGAAGFIGFHTARVLLARGEEVTGFDNLNAYYDPRLKEARLERLGRPAGWSFVRGDLADAPAVAALVAEARPEVVVHLGAQAGVRHSVEHPWDYVRSNLEGFLSVLEACRQHRPRHLLFASSSSVYGANARIPFSEQDRCDAPVSFYGATKKANEGMAHSYAHLYGIPCTGLRFFTVYGPWGRPDMSPILFARAICEGRPIDVFHQGRARRDFTYVDDIVEGMVRLLGRPPVAEAGAAAFRVLNIGNHQPVGLLDYIHLLEKHLGRKADLRLGAAAPGDMEVTYADTSALEALTGFRPATPLEEGLRRFCAWFREYYGIPEAGD